MDKVPHRKTKKGLKKPAILLGLILFALLCLGGTWLLKATQPMPEMPQDTEPLYLLARGSDEIAAVRMVPQNGQSYTLIRKTGQGFLLENEEDIPLRTDAVDALAAALGKMEAVQIAGHLHEDEMDPASFGLSPARLMISLTYQDGQTAELMIGGDVPADAAQYYCMITGDDHIYTVYADVCYPLFYEKDYLRAFDQPDLSGDLLDQIDITGDLQFSLSYTPSGWQMTHPYAYPLNPLRTNSLLSKIESMAFESCLGHPENVDMEALGLANPALTIRLTQAPTLLSGLDENNEFLSLNLPARQYTLLIGHETGKSGVYLQWEGMIYKASNFLLGFWKELQIEDYLLATPVNILINDLNTLSVKTDARSVSYSISMVESITKNNQIATDEYGQILYDAEITRSGEKTPMNAEAFLNWYAALAGLTPSGKLPENWQPDGAPLAEITLHSQSITRSLALYPYDPFYHALSVDGVALYYVENSWLDKIIAAP